MTNIIPIKMIRLPVSLILNLDRPYRSNLREFTKTNASPTSVAILLIMNSGPHPILCTFLTPSLAGIIRAEQEDMALGAYSMVRKTIKRPRFLPPSFFAIPAPPRKGVMVLPNTCESLTSVVNDEPASIVGRDPRSNRTCFSTTTNESTPITLTKATIVDTNIFMAAIAFVSVGPG